MKSEINDVRMMPDYSNCDCDSCDSGYVVLAGIYVGRETVDQPCNLGIDALEPLGSKLLRISRMWKGLMLHRAASRNSSSCFVNLFQLESVIS